MSLGRWLSSSSQIRSSAVQRDAAGAAAASRTPQPGSVTMNRSVFLRGLSALKPLCLFALPLGRCSQSALVPGLIWFPIRSVQPVPHRSTQTPRDVVIMSLAPVEGGARTHRAQPSRPERLRSQVARSTHGYFL